MASDKKKKIQAGILFLLLPVIYNREQWEISKKVF